MPNDTNIPAMSHDDAMQFVLNALEDMPSGPPGREILNVLLAAAWDEGEEAGYDNVWAGERPQATNPYRAAK